MATIDEVATRAGVSVATVSRTLNNSEMVSKEKRDRVMEAVKDLNYKPNAVGRNLRRSESKMVLVVSTNIIEEVLSGIQDVAKELGYDVILSYTGNKRGEMDSIKFLENGLADGVIFSSVNFKNRELVDISNKYPVVQCCEYIDIPELYMVSVDDEKAAYDMVCHLLNLGRKRIGFITLDTSDKSIHFPEDRERGYRRALADFGIPYDPKLQISGDYTYESGANAAKQFICMEERPDAIFSVLDTMAVGCLNALKEEGISIPKEIAIAGFDNIELAQMCEPKLTTVAQPFYQIGRETMRMLVSLIKGEIHEGRRVLLKHNLITRGSSIEN